jgi:transcriptional regulator with XRE-family HTH domain
MARSRSAVAREELRRRGRRDEFGADTLRLQIGDRLKQERRLAGLSREALAAALGTSPRMIEKYENGAEWLPPSHLAAATMALGVSLSEFFFDRPVARANTSNGAMNEPRWITIPRPLKLLSRPDFAQAAPLIGQWKAQRGRLTEEIEDSLLASGVLDRVIILRQPPGSSGLITEHFGSRIVFARRSDIVGRDIAELPDPEYGAFVGEAYSEVMWRREAKIEACRAVIRTWTGKAICARYDRVLIPWSWRGSDRFAMCISLRRGQLAENDSAEAMMPL